jgi:hypothetical protein
VKLCVASLLPALFTACHAPAPVSEPRPAPAPVAVAPEPEPEPPKPPAWDDAATLVSNAGHYVVRYRTEPAPIPWGDPFTLEVWVLDAEGGAPVGDVALSVDAAMPEHGHGMNRVPKVTRGAEERFDVAGMLLHMPGRWELYFDITRGALTERAQVEVELE